MSNHDSTTAPSMTAPIHNSATRAIVSTLGVLIGIGSINHGLLETLQGNRPTPGHIVNALGPGYRWTVWTKGGEAAFTLVPNFLLTGLLATFLGLVLIVWSLRYIQRSYGPTIFLLLSVSSFLVGGGIAQVLLFTLNWAAATRIRAPLGFWHWLIPVSVRRVLGKLWRWTAAGGTILFLAGLEMAVVGYFPGVTGQTRILHLCWVILFVALALFLLSYVFGFAQDLEARARAGQHPATSGS